MFWRFKGLTSKSTFKIQRWKCHPKKSPFSYWSKLAFSGWYESKINSLLLLVRGWFFWVRKSPLIFKWVFSEVYIKCVNNLGSIPGTIELFFELFFTDLNFSRHMSLFSHHMSFISHHMSVTIRERWNWFDKLTFFSNRQNRFLYNLHNRQKVNCKK